jgi:hypothetical protein
MPDAPIKKSRRELCGLMDQHSRNTQNNTATPPDPLVTPFSLNHSTIRQSRKRKLDSKALTDSVTCEMENRVLGSTLSNCSPPSTSPSDKSPKRNSTLPPENEIENVIVILDKVSTNDTKACHPVTTHDYSNVILQFMRANFCCRTSNLFLRAVSKYYKYLLLLQLIFCPGCIITSLPAETREDMGTNDQTNFTEGNKVLPNQYAVLHLHDNHSLNKKMILTLQQVGSGRARRAVFGGLLSIFCDPSHEQSMD